MSVLVDRLHKPAIPDIAFSRLADAHETWSGHIGFNWSTNQFVAWTPIGPPTPDRQWAEANTQLIGHVEDDTGDVIYINPAPSINDGHVVVNLFNPNLDPALFLPDKGWAKHGKCAEYRQVRDIDGNVTRIPLVDTNLFYPEATDTTTARKAKAICRVCPTLTECLRWAVVSNETHGIWGGLGEEERRVPRRMFVQDPEAFADLAESIAVDLRAGTKPAILRYRNTPGVTHGKISTWNRGCQEGDGGTTCDACVAAMQFAASSHRIKKLYRDRGLPLPAHMESERAQVPTSNMTGVIQ